MRKLKVIIICSEFPPQSAGIGYSAYHTAKSLINKGHKVTVITRGQWFKSKHRKNNGINIYELPFIPFFPPLHILYHKFFIYRLLKLIESKYDLIHFHSPLVPAIKTKLPIIVTVHSTWYYESKSYKKIKNWYSFAVHVFKNSFINEEQKLFTLANKFIAVSTSKYNELTKYYNINSSKISVIPNSLNLYNFKLKHTKYNNRFLFIGRLVYAKGLLDLIEAIKLVTQKKANIKLSIIGKGPLEKTIRNRIKKLNLDNNIKLLGYVPNKDIPNYLFNSTALVLPSYYEGLPIVILEAMASGKAVICSNLPSMKEIIIHNKNGLLFNAGNISKLSKAIYKLYKNKQLSTRLGKQAKNDVKQYDSKITVNQLLKQYYKILN